MNVVLGNEGIKQLQGYFREKQRNLYAIVDKIEREIAEIGASVMKSKAPTSDIDGNLPGRVIVEPRPDGWAVSYLGRDVAYIEFGTGYEGQNSPYPDYEVLGTVGWMYDINNHGERGWFYRSKRDGTIRYSRGMRPEKPVFDTFVEMQRQVRPIVERVLHEELG